MRPKECIREVKRKLRKKTTQSTLTQYMNLNGGGKRKRDQTAHSDTNRKGINDTDDGREAKRPKRTVPRQTEVTERKGIG